MIYAQKVSLEVEEGRREVIREREERKELVRGELRGKKYRMKECEWS